MHMLDILISPGAGSVRTRFTPYETLCDGRITEFLIKFLSAASNLPGAAMMDPEVDLGSVDTDSVLTLMECPVCLDHITPPVKQCVKVCR